MDQQQEERVRNIVRDELADESSTTRRGLLTLLGGGAALGAAGTASADSDVSVGGVTADTYRITGNKYGGPDSAKSQLVSELGSDDAGAKYIGEDTGGLYHWDGAAWQLMDSKSRSVSTDRSLTNSRDSGVVIHNTGGTIYVDGPSGTIASGAKTEFSTLMQSAVDAIPNHGSIHVKAFDGWYEANARVTIEKPLHITSDGAQIEVADGMNDHLFYLNLPNDPLHGGQYWRTNVKVAGFGEVHGNKANNSAGSFIRDAGAGTNVWVHNNYVLNFAESKIWVSGEGDGAGGAHVYYISDNSFGGGTHAVHMASAWNWIINNDLGGGCLIPGQGPTWLLGNSIFSSDTHGVVTQGRTMVMNNIVIDNQESGIRYYSGNEDRGVIRGNVVQNNCLSGDFGYGIDIGGSGKTTEGVLVSENRCWNRDTSLVGSGEGTQDVGMALRGTIENSIITDNYLKTGNGQDYALEWGTAPGDNNVVRDNIGAPSATSGNASVADGGTISHGLHSVFSPSLGDVRVWTASTNRAYATAVDDTNITVALEDPSGASVGTAETVYFEADMF
jgi:hypothetical protein